VQDVSVSNGSPQKPLAFEAIENEVAGHLVDAEEATHLPLGQLKAWHFAVLRSDQPDIAFDAWLY
jgi:hypothetical protein